MFRKIITSVRYYYININVQDWFIRENQIADFIVSVFPGMEMFSSGQKRKVRDILELEFYSKGRELVTEGTVNNKVYMIIKGEVELNSSVNLYTMAL